MSAAHLKSRSVRFSASVLAGVLAMAAGLSSYSHAQSRKVRVAAGADYAVAPGGQEWILGRNYRDLWAIPIEVPVLDLAAEASGLSPVRRVGGEQTLGLALRGADGKDYTFRSVDKDLTHVLPGFLRIEAVEEITQDQLTATVPGVEIVVHPFVEALDLLEADAKLVVLPDDPRLGEFQERFAGRLGIFLEYPRPGFMGTTEIQDPRTFWEQRQEDPWNRADSRSFLKARLLDFYLGDWDRHRGQWRWARVPGESLLQPVPEDRDQVFTNYEGVAMAVARVQGIPLVTYEEEYVGIDALTQNGWDLDRFILTDLDRATWLETAQLVRDRITGDVIDEALGRLPPEYYELAGEALRGLLRARRDRIVALAERFYDVLNEKVDIQGSNQAEVVTIEPRDRGVVAVSVALEGEDTPYFERVFLRDETKEIRIYLHGGNDRVIAKKSMGRDIEVHVVGGPGDDEVTSDSSYVQFWDFEGENTVSGEARVKRHTGAFEDPNLKQPNENVPWVPSRDYGTLSKPRGLFGYHPDAGVLVGGGFETTRYGFREYPWSAHSTLLGGFAIGVNRPLVDYQGDFRRAARALHLGLDARFSGVDQLRYYGLGNETPNDGPADSYEIALYQLSVFPALTYSRGSKGRFLVGPIFKVSDSGRTEEGTVLFDESPTGFGSVSQLGVKTELRYDSREEPDLFATGFELRGEAAYYPEVWDIESDFGLVDARFDRHQQVSSRLHLTVSLGGKKVWGDAFPFYEAAYLGGNGTTAGYNWNRFAGDASLYGIANLKLVLKQFANTAVPGELGVGFQADVGRVWLKGEPSTKWHPAFGAGVFYAPFNRFAVLEAGLGRSAEKTFFIFRAQTKFLEF